MPNPVRLQQIADLRRVGLRLKCDIAWLRCILALKRFANAAIKANFNPGQLRIPAGQPGGGQWTDGGGGGLTLVGARGRMSVSVRVRGRQMEVTPAQATRLARAEAWARDAADRVREMDPTWRPTPSLTGTVEGEIAALNAEAREAEGRIRDLERGRFGDNGGPPLDPATPNNGTASPSPSQCIASYRSITGMPDSETVPHRARRKAPLPMPRWMAGPSSASTRMRPATLWPTRPPHKVCARGWSRDIRTSWRRITWATCRTTRYFMRRPTPCCARKPAGST